MLPAKGGAAAPTAIVSLSPVSTAFPAAFGSAALGTYNTAPTAIAPASAVTTTHTSATIAADAPDSSTPTRSTSTPTSG